MFAHVCMKEGCPQKRYLTSLMVWYDSDTSLYKYNSINCNLSIIYVLSFRLVSLELHNTIIKLGFVGL